MINYNNLIDILKYQATALNDINLKVEAAGDNSVEWLSRSLETLKDQIEAEILLNFTTRSRAEIFDDQYDQIVSQALQFLNPIS